MGSIVRRLVAPVICAILFVAAGQCMGATINDFTVFGKTSVIIGGASHITGGLVGSNMLVQLNGTHEVNGNIHSGGDIRYASQSIADGSLFATGTVKIGAGGSIVGGSIDADTVDFTNAGDKGVYVGGNLTYWTSYIKPANGDVKGSVSKKTPVAPALPVFPVATSYSAGGLDISTGNSVTTNLAPGSYGTVLFGNGNHINLTAGNYYFSSLTVNDIETTMNFNVSAGAVRIFTVGNVSLPNQLSCTVTGGPGSLVYAETHGDWSQGSSGNWYGTVFAPSGKITVANTSTVVGSLWANAIDLAHTVTVTPAPVVPEPAGLVALGAGLLGLSGLRRRTRA